ncbi:MAG: transglutaminase-like domain-containing protein [Firmicutes bacterium]|nr:transglutaminase-like domain-containing protein [Bacillota bacterium]
MSSTKDFNVNMGITIAPAENQDSQTIKQAAPQLLIVLLLIAFGIMLTLSSAFRLPLNMALAGGFVVFYALIFGAVFLFIHKKGLAVLSMTALFGLVCVFFQNVLYKGFNQTMGWVGEAIAECSGKAPPWALNAVTAYETIPMTLFFAAFLFPVLLLLSYAVVHRFNIFLLLLIVVPVLEVMFFFGCLPSVAAFVLLVLGSFSMFILNQSAAGRRQNSFDVRGNSVLRRQAGNVSLVTAALAGLLIITAWLLVSESDYASFTNNFSARSQAGETIKKTMSFAYEEKTPPQGGITGGRFSETDEFSFKGETALTVEADSFRGSIYLKGYVGGDYTARGWQPLPDELAKEGEKLSGELQAWNLPAEVIKYDNAMLAKHFSAEKRLLKVTKTDESLLDYQYVPYFLTQGSTAELDINEQGVIRGGKSKNNSYSASYFDILNYDNNLFLLNRQKIREGLYGNLGLAMGNVSAEQLGSYFGKEERYAHFVHKTYTRLPDNLSRRMVEEFSAINTDLSTESIIKTVMGNLSGRAAYTLTPGKTPAEEDYVDYFLYENRKGYCTHFASAATVIFRLCGIPARYVEGYVVTIEDYARATWTEEGRYIMDIKDTNSHAWCEIYLDGFGWAPVEVTPGLVSVNTGGTAPAGGESIEYETDAESELNEIPMRIPQVEYTPAEGASADGLGAGTEDNGVFSIKFYLSIILAMAVSLLLILCILWQLLRKRAVKGRIKELRHKNLNQASLSWYAYIMDALKIAAPQYLINREISDLAWAGELEKKTVFPEGTFLHAMPVIQKAAYSHGEISASEHQSLVRQLENAVQHLYEGLPGGKKFKWRYIKRLPIYKEIVQEGEKHCMSSHPIK